MCELFGISSEQQIPVNDLLREFYSHSVRHPNGWGLATFCGGTASIEKEPVQASNSAYLRERLSDTIQASTLLAHIRLATVGSIAYSNCHPFVQQDSCSRCWVLIHNGTIFHGSGLAPYQGLQQGKTDSERILLYLVDQVNQRQAATGHPLDAAERFQLLDLLLSDLSLGNKLNLMLYDGERLYVHCNYANSLYVCEQDGAAVFCTVPLQAGHWKPLPFTTLCAYQNGRLVLAGQPHGHAYVDNPENMSFLLAAQANL